MKKKQISLVVAWLIGSVLVGSILVNLFVSIWGNSLKWGSGSEDIWIGFWGSILGGIIGCLGVVTTTYFLISSENKRQRELLLLKLETENLTETRSYISGMEQSFNNFFSLGESYLVRKSNPVSGGSQTLDSKYYGEWRNIELLIDRCYTNESMFFEGLSDVSNLISDFKRVLKTMNKLLEKPNHQIDKDTFREYERLADEGIEVIGKMIIAIKNYQLELHTNFSKN